MTVQKALVNRLIAANGANAASRMENSSGVTRGQAKRSPRSAVALTIGLVWALGSATAPEAHAQGNSTTPTTPPRVFQAAGPTVASIQSTVDEYRAALGATNNGNAPGPLSDGRREINWDGGNANNLTTAIAGNPFAGFQVTRGALFTTPNGSGFVQAPAAADPTQFPPGGLAGLFNNPSYENIFQAFSPQRLFTPIGSTTTIVDFFVPGGGELPATVTGFGSVFTDVDRQDAGKYGRKYKKYKPSTVVQYFDVRGKLLYSSFVPTSPGDKSVSFFGIVFDDARIARVRIRTGNTALGPDDGGKKDVVVMDDFLYGEPQPLH